MVDRFSAAQREGLAARMLRRAFSVPFTAAMFLFALASSPIWIPLAALGDRTSRKRRAGLACLLFLTWYLWCELCGIAAAGWLWLRALLAGELGSDADLARLFRLQTWWAGQLLDGASRLFGFRVSVEGGEAATADRMLLLLRHASVADTVLAARYVSQAGGIRLRYVIKRELLWDPCLDLVGNRLPNYFVRRDAVNTAREVEGIISLLAGLGPKEGVLIYPEGTRFTPAKRASVIERLRSSERPELAARAEKLAHTLPPRLGGTLGLLQHNPGLDVVFCAHTGFEGAGSFWDLWNGELGRVPVRVCFWRVPFRELPTDTKGLEDFLFAHWQRIDRWIGEQVAA